MSRLNHDCVRKILLYVEKEIQYTKATNGKMQSNSLGLNSLYESEFLSEFTQEDIWYTVIRLFEARYITGYTIPTDCYIKNNLDSCSINGLTMEGHTLVDNVRENPVWSKTKTTLKSFGEASIQVASKIATDVAVELAKAQMGIK